MWTESWTEFAHALAKYTKAGESIILYNVGIAGYYSDLVIYDMYGLTHREAARAARIQKQASPGHDMIVPDDFFFSYQPTYISAILVPKGKVMNLSILAERSSYLEDIVVERHELLEEDGFTPGADLILGRVLPALPPNGEDDQAKGPEDPGS